MSSGVETMYQQIHKKKIYEQVADQLIQQIKNGSLKPGDKLSSVEQLAESFRVSRSAIREALSALKAMGLIEMRQGEGTYVRQYDPRALSSTLSHALLMNREDVRQLFEIRRLLETGSAVFAARRRTEEDLERFRYILDQMELYVHDHTRGEQLDWTFHLAIAQAARNHMLVNLLNSVSEIIITAMQEARQQGLFAERSIAERLNREHRAIYDAIAAQDAEQARLRMLDHLNGVEQLLSGRMGEQE